LARCGGQPEAKLIDKPNSIVDLAEGQARVAHGLQRVETLHPAQVLLKSSRYRSRELGIQEFELR
jgi:hypothetical protein